MANNFNLKIDIDLAAAAGSSKAFQDAAKQAMKETAAELDGRFDDAISGAYWPWPRASKRGLSGSTVGERAKSWAAKGFNTSTPRSIVDSGELKQSKNFKLNGLEASWTWTANYAAAVHEGARIHPWGDPKNGTVNLPGRPWTDAVLVGGTAGNVPVFDFTTEFSKRLSRRLS